MRLVGSVSLVALFLLPTAAVPAAEPETSDRCRGCHRDIYRMWRLSAHARAMENEPFLDALDEVRARDAALAGRCVACHAPLAVATGDDAMRNKTSWEGVNCDFCHSMSRVEVARTGAIYDLDVGGAKRGPIRKAQDLGHPVEYSPLHSSSLICAPCHQYTTPEGAPIMTTYAEWESSKAAKRGESCQACHMGLTRGNVVDARVLRAPAAQINVHEMPGGHSIQQLHEALHVTLDAERQEDGLRVDVTLENRGAGHAVPTGMPGRRILLELEVRTGDGRTYTEERTYAKQFVDNLNRPIAHVADLFGDDVKLARDTRIGVDEVRSESWTFDVPANSLAWVEAKLHYEHTPRGKDEDSTFLTFFSEKRTVRRAQAED